MAHLYWYGKIIKRWKSTTTDLRYHLTETNWLLKSEGPKMGRVKVVVKPKDVERLAIVLENIEHSERFTQEQINGR